MGPVLNTKEWRHLNEHNEELEEGRNEQFLSRWEVTSLVYGRENISEKTKEVTRIRKSRDRGVQVQS